MSKRRDKIVKALDKKMADALPGAVGPNVRKKLAEIAIDDVSTLIQILEEIGWPDPMTTREDLSTKARSAVERLET